MDVKYSYYVTTAGFRKVGGTAAQFLKADGSVDAKSYALASGTNATGSWANSSNGLENNPTLPGKTLNGGITSSLQDANNGTIAGYLNSAGTAYGNPSNDWWFRLKMLHPNAAGYNGEIAVQMTGSLSMRYRRMEYGFESGWIKTLDEATNSMISGMNSFRTVGNQYDSMALHAYSDSAASPAIAFHKAGQYAGSIAMINSGLYQFRDLSGTGLVNTQVSISHATNGFVHNGYNDPDILLKSNGGVIHRKDLLPEVIESDYNGQYIDLAQPEFREYQIIVKDDDVIINIPFPSAEIKGIKFVIKFVDNPPGTPPILEIDGNMWGTVATMEHGAELICTDDNWIFTHIAKSERITL